MNDKNNLPNLSPKEEFDSMLSALKIVLPIITILFGVLFILNTLTGKKTTQDDKPDYKYSAYNYSKDLVKEKLKSPSSADFPLYDESFVTKKGDTYTVIAYVDAKNSFGAEVRTNYVADVTFINDVPSGKVVIIE